LLNLSFIVYKMNTLALKKLSLLLVFFLTLFVTSQINSQIKDIKIIHPLMGTISLSLGSGIAILQIIIVHKQDLYGKEQQGIILGPTQIIL